MKAKRFWLAVLLSTLGCIFALAGCGDKPDEGKVDDGHTHDYVWNVTKPATCKEKGSQTGVCSICGKEEVQEIPLAAHTLSGEVTVITDSTCSIEGEGTQICSVCNTPQPVKIPKKNHTLEHIEGDPGACNRDGTIEHWHCTVCERNFTDEAGTVDAVSIVIPKENIPHNYVNGVCSVCNKQENPDSHKCVTEKVDGVASTCSTRGVKEHYKCTICGKLYADASATRPLTPEDVQLDFSNDHGGSVNAVHYYEVPAKDCLTYGKKERYDCKVCGRHFKDEDLTQEYKEVGEDGICDEDTLQNPKDPAHKTWHGYAQSEPTCSTVGWKQAVVICEICGAIYAESEFDMRDGSPTKNQPKTKDDGTQYAPLNRAEVEIPIEPNNHSETPTRHDVSESNGCGSANAGFRIVCYECNYCHKFFDSENYTTELTNDEVYNYGEHGTMKEENEVDSTCTTHGHPHCWTCENCNEHFDTKTPSASTLPISEEDYNYDFAPHDYADYKSNSKGHWYICSMCDSPQTDDDGNIIIEDHEYDEDDDTCVLCGYGNVDFVGFFTFEYNSDSSEAYITGLEKNGDAGYVISDTDETVLTIPEFDRTGTPITKIQKDAFSLDKHREYASAFAKIEEVYIPSTITEVGENAFGEMWSNNSHIKKIEFERSGNTAVKIGASAFCSLNELVTLILPKVMVDLPASMVYQCGNLTTVKMPESLSGNNLVLESTFKECSSLKEIDLWCLNGLVWQLGTHAFFKCAALETIYMPTGCVRFGTCCLSGCISVKKLYFGGSLQNWNAILKTADAEPYMWNYNTPTLQNLETNGVLQLGYTHSGN